MVMDLKDARTSGFGVEMLGGSSEQTVSAAQTDGTWVAMGTDGGITEFTASGTRMNFMMNGMMGSTSGVMVVNSSWTGFVTPSVNGGERGRGADGRKRRVRLRELQVRADRNEDSLRTPVPGGRCLMRSAGSVSGKA